MYSHFSVILLCFSGVYCILSKIENLNLDELKEIWSGQTTIKEWETAMDQNIFYNDNNIKTTVNVNRAVNEFIQKANNGDETGFERIRNIIKTAYQCTLAKYASLNAYLMVQDVRDLKANISMTVTKMRNDDGISYDAEKLFENLTFINRFPRVSGKKYHIDFDVRFRGRLMQILGDHDFENTPSKEWQSVWADIIMKALTQYLGFKIKYKIYPDVIGVKFTNQFDLPDVHVLNEIACVLNEVIQLFDSFVVDNCVRHGGRFKDNFRSLRKGINNDVIQLTNYLDKNQAKSSYWALYRDYSRPLPGTSQASNEIRGSGGFVENVEFKISGLKMDLPNYKNPTEIYGRCDNERTSEIILELVKTKNDDGANVMEVCMVKFRDPESLTDERLNPVNDVILTMFT